MRWRNTETPTFVGSAGSGKAPSIVEAMELQDRDGNVVATYTKSVAGVYTLNVVGAISQSGVTLASAFVYKGAIDCSSNPNWPAASAGDVYKVSVAGKIGGSSGKVVQASDVLICNVAGIAGTDAAVGANWMIEQGDMDKASGSEVDTGTDDAKYITPKALADSAYPTLAEAQVGNTSGNTTGNTVGNTTGNTVGNTTGNTVGNTEGNGGTYEIPTGTVNGINAAFVFSAPPILVFRNGVMETRLGSVSTNTFTFDTPPDEGDDIEGLV
jgi:hypothetical protein